MIKKFAETLEYEIPERLKPHVVTPIYGETKDKVDVTFPIFPNGFAVLIHVYGDLPQLHVNNNSGNAPSRLNIAGQIHGTIPKMTIDGYFGQNGYLLHPLTPYYLFHLKGNSFVNSWKPLESTNVYNWDLLIKKLWESESIVERINLLTEMLMELESKRLPAIVWLDNCIETIYRKNGNVAVNELIATTDFSNRHFSRVFSEIVGVPPKYFCKVVQLNGLFEAINSSDNDKILQLALEYGYYDQSHFIHDFKKLIGDSPQRFLMGKDSYVKEYLGRKSM